MATPSVVDEITLVSDRARRPASSKRLLIFYIAGNPGLVGYYEDFLVKLQQNLQKADEDRDVIIYGASSDGFEIHSAPKPSNKPPYGLQQQIEFTKQRLQRKVIELSGEDSPEPMPVVLVAHSVGAYMLLELVAWWQEQTDQQALYHLAGGICLFPTVVDIAKSQKGRQLSWLLGLPGISLVLQWLARVLVLVPTSVWNWPQALNPGPAHAEVTEAMLRSRYGVRQVIYMANDEMRMIKANKWPDEFWGLRAVGEEAANRALDSESIPKTKLYFYFGNDDYWVDNKIRDDLIAQRASRGGVETEDFPQMRIDNHGIPHTFSLDEEHTKIVAGEVAEYVCEIKQRCRNAGLL